jgi:hypothetical protein
LSFLYPFTAIVGQEPMKRALTLAALLSTLQVPQFAKY